MAIIAVAISDHMHSAVELISRLTKKIHKITCLFQPLAIEKIARHGRDYIEIPEINFRFTASQANKTKSSRIKTFGNHLIGLHNRYKHGKKLLKLEQYEIIWTELKPDHVMVDVELYDLIFTAKAAKIPVIQFHTWFSDTPSYGLPPIHTSITPSNNLGGSTLRIVWDRVIDWAKIRARLFIKQLKYPDYRRATLKRYAKEIGFSVAHLSVNTLPPLYRFKKSPILLLAFWELDFQHRSAKNLSYVGPMVYENRHDLDPNSPDTKRLNEIFTSKKISDKKLIYCSVSSFVTRDVAFLKRVVQAVRGETGWIMVLSTGVNLSVEKRGVLPKNVHVFDWLPQWHVLKKADCSINNDGINGINECLHFSMPKLVYSGKMFDQNGNAVRINYHGMGLWGDKDQDDVAAIHENIWTVLTDTKYRKTISQINGLYEEFRQRKLSPLIFR